MSKMTVIDCIHATYCRTIVLCTFFIFCLSANGVAQTYTVNSTLDTPDANVGDGVCADGSGNCTLRAAIEELNGDASVGGMIDFNLPVASVIQPLSQITPINDANVTIDGGNLGDIIIDGNSLVAIGLEASSASSGGTIRNLEILNFTNFSIRLFGDNYTINNNALHSNDISGLAYSTNMHTITFNYFYDNTISHIKANGMNCTIQQNTLGLDSDGNASIVNAFNGIEIGCTTCSNVQDNLISNNIIANCDVGIEVYNGAFNNQFTQNSIYCNTTSGITLNSGTNNDLAAPVITYATETTVVGTGSVGSSVEVFIDDDTGCIGAPCQGKTYRGITVVNGSGQWTYSNTFSLGSKVSATATDATLNTSPFSMCAIVEDPCAAPYLISPTTIEVVNSNDSGPGSLRAAIDCVNADPVLDNIVFNATNAPYNLTPATQFALITDDDVQINGASLCTIDANSVTANLFEVTGNNFVLQNLTIENTSSINAVIDLSGASPLINSIIANNVNYVIRIDALSTNPNVTNCTFTSTGAATGIFSGNGVNATITGNNISGFNTCILGRGSCDIQSNEVSNANNGISLSAGSGHIVQNNIVYDNNIGVQVFTASTTLISQNEMYCNSTEGISLSSGGNANYAAPTFSYVSLTEAVGTANPSDVIEVFVNDDATCPGDPCQGRNYLGNATADASGNWSLTGLALLGGEEITATARATNNNTSEFSVCAIAVNNCSAPYVISPTTIEVHNTNDSGPGSLRAAIECCNADPTLDNINFNITGFTPPANINLLSALPDLGDEGIIIDATTQVGWVPGSIILDGTNAGVTEGITSNSANAGIYGLRIQNFQNEGIVIAANNNTVGSVIKPNVLIACSEGVVLGFTWSDNAVVGNFIGVEENGVSIQANNIGIRNISSGSTISNNVIGGNSQHGILLTQSDGASLTNNFIGISSDGITAIGNDIGIKITNGASNHTIGGTALGNTIAFNNQAISNDPGSSNNLYQENSIFCNSTVAIDNNGANGPAPPVIVSADLGMVSGTTAIGSTVELFIHDESSCPGVPCQGKTFLGSFIADLAGNWTYSGGGYNAGDELTATASLNGTSEFSNCLIVEDPCGAPYVISPTTIQVVNLADSGPGSLRAAIECCNADPTLDNIIFDLVGPGPHTIDVLTVLPQIIDDGISIDGGTLGQVILDGDALPSTGINPILLVGADNFSLRNMELINNDNVQGGILANTVDNILINTCRVVNTNRAIRVTSCTNVTIEQSFFDANVTGPHIWNCDMITFDNNEVTNTTTTSNQACWFQASMNATITNNTFSGNLGTGLSIANIGSNNIIVSNNDVLNNLKGILINDGTSITVEQNTINNNTEYGMLVDDEVLIRQNTINNNGENGIELISATTNITITENSIFCNGLKGIEINTTGNNSQATPIITNATVGSIEVSNCTAGDIVEVFVNPTNCTDCEGESFLGNATDNLDGTFSYTGGGYSIGDEITVTSRTGDFTSEFSACALVSVSNDLCSSPETLMNGINFFDDNTGATADLDFCGGSDDEFTLWYEYTTTMLSDISVVVNVPSGDNVSLALLTDCSGTELIGDGTSDMLCSAPGNPASLVVSCIPGGTTILIPVSINPPGAFDIVITENSPSIPVANSVTFEICSSEQTNYDLTIHNTTVNPSESVIWFNGDPDAGGVQIVNPTATDMTTITTLWAFVSDGISCSNTAMMNFSFITAPDAGIDMTIDVCSDDAAINLITVLGGTPDPGGTWTGPSALSNGDQGTFDPAVNLPGVYNYFLAGTPPCADILSAVTVNLFNAPNSGGSGTITICDGETTLQDLFATLSGTPDGGGAWSDIDGTGVNLTNPNAVDFSSLPPGLYTYKYTVVGAPACGNSTTDVFVSVTAAANAGLNGNLSLCEGDNNLQDLFLALNGSPDLGGVWNDFDGSGVDISNPNAVDFSSLPPGMYSFEYVVTGSVPCPDNNAFVFVSIVDFLSAGVGIPQIICEGETNLLDLLGTLNGADVGGTWTDDDGAGVDLTNPNAVDFSAVPPGSYNFTYTQTNTAPCPVSTAVQTVSIQDAMSAGTSSILTLCEGEATQQDLLASLLGSPDPGGIWSESSSSGADISNPNAVDFSGVPVGTYIFLYNQTNNIPCSNEMSILTVNILTDVDAGGDGMADYCENDPTLLDLYGALSGTPDIGGTWVDADGAGVDLSDPTMVDFVGVTPGVYNFVYTIMGSGSCPTATSTATITVIDTQEAGMDATLDICEGDATLYDFENLLGPFSDAAGTWDDVDGTGVNLVDPTAVDLSGLSWGTYVFEYSFDANGSCLGDLATITVNVEELPSAGMDGNIDICEGESQFQDLFAALNGSLTSAAGTWMESTTSGVDISNPYVVSFASVPPGMYLFTYEVTGINCPNSTATVTVNIEPAFNNPGSAAQSICSNNTNPVNLVDFFPGVVEPNGTWSDPNGSGVDLTDPTAVNFSGVSPGAYNFIYTLSNAGPCPDVSGTISITILEPPTITFSGSTSFCPGNTTVINPGGDPGTWNYQWFDSDGNPVPHVDGEITVGIADDYTVIVESPNLCTNTDMITIVEDPSLTVNILGEDICDGNMVTLDAGPGFDSYNWFDGVGTPLGNSQTLDINIGGTYNVEVSANGCMGMDDIVISAFTSPSVVANLPNPVCNGTGGTTIINFTDLLTGDISGSWSDDNASGVDLSDPMVVDFNNVPEGMYDFTYTTASANPPCSEALVSITVIVQNCDCPTALIDVPESICSDIGVIDLTVYEDISNAPGFWEIDDVIVPGNMIDISTLFAGPHVFEFVLETPVMNCPESVIEPVEIFEFPTLELINPPIVGNDAAGTCPVFINFDDLIVQGQLGGTWTDLDGSGADFSGYPNVVFEFITEGMYSFEYSLSANGPCPSNAQTITVTVADCDCPLAVTTLPFEFCSTEGVIDLTSFEDINNAPGYWEVDNVLVPGAMLDLTTLSAGVHNFNFLLDNPMMNCPTGSLTPVEIFLEQNVSIQSSESVGNDIAGSCPTELNFNDLIILGGFAGTWTDTDGSGVDLVNPLAVSFIGVPDGTYTFEYSIPSNGPCSGDSDTIEIMVSDCSCPTILTLDIPTQCTSGSVLDLMDYVDPNSAPGNWFIVGGPQIPSNLADVSLLGPATIELEYVLTNPVNGCPESSQQTLEIVAQDNPGVANSTPSFCSGVSELISLFDLLDNEDIGGLWIETSTVPTNPGAFDSIQGTLDVSLLSPNSYTFNYVIPASAPCIELVSEISVVITEGLNLNLILDGDECDGTPIVVSVDGQFDSYLWSNGGTGSQISVTDPDEYTVTVTDSNNCSGEISTFVNLESIPFVQDDEEQIFNLEESIIDVTLNDDLSIIGSWTIEIVDAPTNGVAFVTTDNQIQFSVENSLSSSDEFTYEICNDNCPDLCSQAVVQVVYNQDLSGPTILLTPDNGDGVNDVAVILDNIQDYPDNRIVVFNEWGDLVFDKEAYQNDWDGTGKGGVRLPQGTYYYYLRFYSARINEIYGMIVILK